MRATTREHISTWTFVLVFATTFYSLGGGTMESYVNYRSWRTVSPADWHAFRSTYDNLWPVFVIPFFGSFFMKALLIFFRPPNVPRWGAVTLALLHLVTIIVTVAIFIPRFQIPLAKSADPVLIDRLITLDTQLRGIPGILDVVLMLWLAAKALKREPDASKSGA